jgi:hypothetical protein
MGVSSSTGVQYSIVKIVHWRLGIVGPLVGRRDIQCLVIDGISSMIQTTEISENLTPSKGIMTHVWCLLVVS